MISPRLAALPDYPFDRLRGLLDGLRPPPGVRPMVLSVGEPRHPPPAMVADILTGRRADWGRYPPVEGTPEFRQAVGRWLERRYALPAGLIDPDRHIIPVSGTREALFLAATVAVADRQEDRLPVVVMPNPFYHVYLGAAVMAGADPVFLAARRETGFQSDLAALDAATLDRTALAYLCSPANPQGTFASLKVLKEAVTLARAYGFVLVVDECYTEIYDVAPPTGALEACAALGEGFDNVLVFHSLSKRSSVPGLRSGFVAGDASLIAAFRRLRTFGGATVPLPVLAASAALWDDDDHVEANRVLYRRKLDLAQALLDGRFGFYRPPGGFFLWLEVGDDQRAARALWTRGALRVLPGRFIGADDPHGGNPGAGFIRVALIDDLSSTEEALRRLVNVL